MCIIVGSILKGEVCRSSILLAESEPATITTAAFTIFEAKVATW